MSKSWRDPSFAYQGEASHANANNFRNRMKKRAREAELKRKETLEPVPLAPVSMLRKVK